MREKYIQWIQQMTNPLIVRISEDKTRIHLGDFAAGYGKDIAQIEGLLRLLWGLTPLWKTGELPEVWTKIYIDAFRNGTNPEHEGYWGDLHDRDQRIVEMAAIAMNLLSAPEWIYDQLKCDEQDNLGKWLKQVNQCEIPDNNWHFFIVMVNIALKKRELEYSQEKIDYGIRRYEDFYLGRGWYSDGLRPQKDYYTSFGIHFYCLLYYQFMSDEEPERCQRYLDRAKEFAKTFSYWFDEEGRAIAFGRSMTYRFAQVAFWSIYVTLVKEADMLLMAKRIIQKNLDYWMKQPIYDNVGVLAVGYGYPNLIMSEIYNSPGSPYWAFKSFYFLLLDKNHDFWRLEQRMSSCKEAIIPIREAVMPIKEADMVVLTQNNHQIALTAGQFPTVAHTYAAAKYAKFAYSSIFSFSVPRSNESIEEAATDSMLAFEYQGIIYVRKKCSEFGINDQNVYSVWRPIPEIEVKTTLIPSANGYKRIHEIQSQVECIAYECGFAFPFDENGYTEEKQNNYALIGNHKGYSKISSNMGVAKIINALPNTNLLFPLTKIPCMKLEIPKGAISIVSSVECSWEESIKEGL